MLPNILFNSWPDLLRVGIIGVFTYCGLVALLRISGKRTLSKMNAFDLVVTVALGSILATTLMSKDVSLAEGISALALLILLQFIVAWTATRSRFVSRTVKAEPTLLVCRGQLMESALAHERVTRDEVFAAVRKQGHASLEDIEAVVLETDGSFSVVQSAPGNSNLALQHISGYPEQN